MDNIKSILSSNGSIKDILSFIEKANLLDKSQFSFEHIYWLLNNKEFYTGLVNILKSRSMFDSTVWKYSFVHNDVEGIKEYIKENY